jgi:alpha-tubulin suppressor-like RCC1 family protein
MRRARSFPLLVFGAWLAFGCVDRAEVLGPEPERDAGDGGTTPPAAVTSVALGEAHGCAVVNSRLYCWGNNDSGELGLGDAAARDRPVLVAGEWVAVTAGAHHTCARDDLGRVACFGANARGQLGTGDREERAEPAFVALPAPASFVTSSFEHTCALLTNAELHCWGKNEEGEMGQDDAFPGTESTDADALLPVAVPGSWRAVDAGQGHTCAIRLDGALFCWGRNSEHELGDADMIQVRFPIQVGTDTDWLGVDAGQHHTCGLREDRLAYCWGQNNSFSAGQGAPLGIPGVELVETPTRVEGVSDLALLRSDTFHTCVVDRSADLSCWGRNVEGQLGLGDQELRETPVLVASGRRGLAVGRFQTCAVAENGSLACTGKNDTGQLGTGDNVERWTLSPVTFPPP